MENFTIAFNPELPLWLSTGLCIVIAIACLFGLFFGLRGAWIRSIAALLLCFSLFNPSLLEEDRTALPTIIPMVVDQTTSQKLNDRDVETENAVATLREQFDQLEGYELREIRVRDQISTTSDVSSALFKSLDTALQDIPREQLGASLFITDGQVHDVPEDADKNSQGPVHVLLTGKENEKDRRIILKQAPRFGVVGENQELIFEVNETGFGDPQPVDVTIRFDGEPVAVERVLPGEDAGFVFEVPHGGQNIIELEAQTADGEITEINNRVFTNLTGIRENLRVLLVSGEPHAGERTWRNLLKSDASVDLVHFTILRPPEKQDGTPINQLSLIAFPTRELFVQKIDEFDLIIFDRYKRRGVLPILYFDNIASYVRNGGAVLVAAGPEYAEPVSIATTPLNVVLPAISDGRIIEEPFVPQLSDTGEKHPVTRNLDGWNSQAPSWSRWFRAVGVEEGSGETVMVDENDRPILMLQRQQEGRVALLLSDHVWLWSRGFEGGGPHGQLLRRMAHWLMKEPDLEEERLTAISQGETLTITRQTLGDEPGTVRLTSPSGDTVELKLENNGTGQWQASYKAEEIGLYRLANDQLTALSQIGPANPRELAAVVSTSELLQTIADTTKGSITRLADNGVPRLLAVGTNATTKGNGWIGLPRTQASVLNGVFRIPLFVGLLGLAVLLLAFASTWYREGR
ncbi:MAG: hypothetical protein AAF217_01950 [Pseudomonadota bacterium]